MNNRTQQYTFAALVLGLAMVLPATGSAKTDDGPLENAGKQVDKTATELRDGAAKGIDAAREAFEKTGKALDERAKEAADAVNGDGE